MASLSPLKERLRGDCSGEVTVLPALCLVAGTGTSWQNRCQQLVLLYDLFPGMCFFLF